MNKYKFEGWVLGAEIAEPIVEVTIKTLDYDRNTIKECFSDGKGQWSIQLNDEVKQISFSHPDYVGKIFCLNNLPERIRLLNNKLIGYQSKLWYKSGQIVDVFVYSPTQYKAVLFRHGFEKKSIKTLACLPPQHQSVPDEDFTENGLQWQKSFEYRIPEDIIPGLYSILLEAQDQEPFAIPMIISSSSQQSKILILASTNNWQTYNIWGGRNRYRNFVEFLSEDFALPSLKKKILSFFPTSLKQYVKKIFGVENTIGEDWMFRKLSIKRPFTNCLLEDRSVLSPFTNHLAAGEWRVLAWLEKNDIEYDIISGYELHHAPAKLNGYSGIILSTHCEYWSKEMYETLKHHHENKKLWLINISGNTMYREVGFFDDGSIQCKSLLFNETVADESQLLGVRFSDIDYGTSSNYKIVKGNHWVFDGIEYNRNSLYFGNKSLNQNTKPFYKRYDPGRPGSGTNLKGQGASGWETDKLTQTASKDIIVVSKGMNKNGGADMVVREPDGNSGGLFSASSITFGGSLLIDKISSGIVLNVLKRILNENE